MSDTGSTNEKDIESELPEQQFPEGQATAFEQLLRLQNDIEGQGSRVARAVSAIAEALNNDGNVSLEMLNHLKAQILLAHLQLDELRELLDIIDW
jgi:hypothetical protein